MVAQDRYSVKNQRVYIRNSGAVKFWGLKCNLKVLDFGACSRLHFYTVEGDQGENVI